MMDIPKTKLGDVTAITIFSPDLDQSVEYYKKLGFTVVLRNEFPFPWVQVSDGALLIMLRKDSVTGITLTYYVKELENVVAELERAGIIFFQKPASADMIKRYLFKSPDGLTIALVTYVDGFSKPSGLHMLSMQQGDFFNPDTYTNKICGIYGEFAHPVTNLEESILFWEKLGFSVLSKQTQPYPWAIISDGLAIIGLHQTNSFTYPVITFFAADMKEKIENLKKKGLDNFTESGAGNIVLTTPEQQKINLFKMGM